MDAARERGEYHDPDAGKSSFGDFGKKWLVSWVVDPSTMLRYKTAYRLHVAPVLAHLQVRDVKPSRIQWDDPVVVAVIDAHHDELRAIPELAASLGKREGELFGLAAEDLDLDQDKIVRVRRLVKRIGRLFVFALPKNDRERVILWGQPRSCGL
jgi:integrase